MINMTLGQSGVTEFNVATFVMDALLGNHFSSELSDNKVILHSSKNDYVQLTGSFDFTNGATLDSLDNINEITAFKSVVDGKTGYQLTGLELTPEMLSSFSKLSHYLNSQNYRLEGNDLANSMTSGDNSDTLLGMGGNDYLYSNGGNDTLDGGKGNDNMFGGAGNDTYLLDSTGDRIHENKNAGTDTVKANFTVDLSKIANVENITLLGSGKLSGIGNDLDNDITGNSGINRIIGGKGEDTIEGKAGNDLLSGGTGVDHFVFARGDKYDTITDFDATGKDHDVIDLGDFGAKLSFHDIDISRLGKHDVDIDFGKGDHIVLQGVNVKDVDINDFQF